MSITAIIPAAGVGSRFSKNIKKQFFEIDGKPVLYYTILSLINSFNFDEFIIGCGISDFDYIHKVFSLLEYKNFKIVEGGRERSDTVYNCLLKNYSNFVLIHDAVRPFINSNIVNNVINEAEKSGAAICGLKIRDTVKRINSNIIEKTIDRDLLLLSHTPQVFNAKTLLNALEFIKENNLSITDEAQAFEIIGKNISWVNSSPDNIKITYSEDINLIYLLINKFFK